MPIFVIDGLFFPLICDMNKIKRLVIEVVLWLAIGIIIWLNQDTSPEILKENLVIFLFQIILVGSLIYFGAPKLLFKEKYVLFALYSIALIAISVWALSFLFSMQFAGSPPIGGSEFGPPHPPPEMRRPPSHYMLHTLVLTIAYILATVIESFIYLKKKEEETIKAKNINLQNELKLLKSQINPHFLFNSLNNIYTLAGIDSNKTQKSIINLSDMLRYVLYECDQDSVPLKKEVEYIENYLKLFALKSSMEYPISADFNISNDNILIAPMLLIPFIENALKHSNIDYKKQSFIHIEINADDDIIDFEIVNSLPQKTIIKDKNGGIGLENVKKRLAILYPEKHQLEIDENDTSFKVKLHLKL